MYLFINYLFFYLTIYLFPLFIGVIYLIYSSVYLEY